MKRTIMSLFFLTVFASLSYAVPIEVNYQGYLTDQNGAPVDGTTNITFKLYMAINAITEEWSETIPVDVNNGVYSVVLGANGGNPIPLSLFDGTPALGIVIESDPEMTPRQELKSVAFSIRALSADSVVDGAVTNATITGPISASKIEQGPGTGLDADTVDSKHAADLQNRVTGTCGPGSSVSTVNADGSVVCVPTGLPGTVTSNYVPRSDGAGLVDSTIFDDGNVGIGTSTPNAKLDVFTGPIDVYGNWINYDIWYEPCDHCVDTCNGDDVAEYICPGGQSISCEDLRNSDGEEWQYRAIECEKPQEAAQFTGGVTVTETVQAASFTGGNINITGQVSGNTFVGNGFAGDGSNLTNVTAADIGIICPVGQILQKTSNGWECALLCQDGDFVKCYEGPGNTIDVGLCVSGVRTCSNGLFGTCAGQVVPVTETCDGADDDCNGTADDVSEGAPGCTPLWPDQDSDTYGDMFSSSICLCPSTPGYAGNGNDCLDTDSDVHPGSTLWHSSAIPGSNPANWDYNCDSVEEKKYEEIANCVVGPAPTFMCVGQGWTSGPPPACGVTASWTVCLYDDPVLRINCHGEPTTQTQSCR